jgi:LacI family transcriptional regulator
MSVTLKEVAIQAGLSFQTVSKVLSGRQRHLFRPETAERVLRTAERLGYRPNTSARAMREGKRNCVALLLSTNEYRSHLPDRLLEGIHDALAERGLQLLVSRLPDEKLTEEGFVPRVLSEWSCDGLLVNYTDHIPPRMVELIREHTVPAVWINTKLDGACVRPDDEDAGYRATRSMIERGHEKVAYVQAVNWGAHYSTSDRLAGYERAMEEAGLSPLVWGNLDGDELTPETMREGRSRMLGKLRERIAAAGATGFVGYGPTELFQVVRAAESMGKTLCEDFDATCFSEGPLDGMGLPVPVMLIPEYEVGRRSVDMLIEGPGDAETVTVPFAASAG